MPIADRCANPCSLSPPPAALACVAYDAIGNPLTYRDGMSMTWSGRNLTGLAKDGQSISYAYDANGLRSKKTAGGVTTLFYNVGGEKLGEYRSNGTDLRYHIDEKGSIYAFSYNGATYYKIYNAQGDVIGLYDYSGPVVARYTYDAWGKPLTITDGSGNDVSGNPNHIANINPFRYRDYYYDTETGFYYLNSRYYDPETKRFLNADSEISGTGKLMGYNLFSYCFNNPVNMADWYGAWPEWLENVGNKIGSAFQSLGNGFCDFFTDQYNAAKSFFEDPLGSIKDYYSDPWNWFPAAKLMRDQYYEVSGMWKAAFAGDVDSLAYGVGQRAGLGVEMLATAGITKSVQKAVSSRNPLSKIRYTSKVQSQMELGDNHSFPKIVDNYGNSGIRQTIIGGDGIQRTKISIPGYYKGKAGFFEYIIESDGSCNHRIFRE